MTLPPTAIALCVLGAVLWPTSVALATGPITQDSAAGAKETNGIQTDSVAPRGLLATARKRAEGGHVDSALVAYQALMKSQPDAVFVTVEAGNMLAGAGRFADALPYFVAATKRDPLNFDAVLGQAITRDGLGHDKQAEELYIRALMLRPNDRRARFNLGRIQYQHGELTAAEATYQDLLARHPGDWKALNNLGLVLLDRGEPTSAMLTFQRGLRNKPGDAGLLYNLGRSYAARHQHRRALDMYARALEAWGPKDLGAGSLHLARGDSLFALTRYAEAAQAYEQAVEIDPHFTDAWLNLGAARANAGDNPGAIKALERALEYSPQQAEIHRMIALCYLDDRELDAALVALETAATLDGGSPETKRLISQVERDKQKALDRARALAEACAHGDRKACDEAKKEPPM